MCEFFVEESIQHFSQFQFELAEISWQLLYPFHRGGVKIAKDKCCL